MKAGLRKLIRRARFRRTVYLISLAAALFEYQLATAAEPLELDKTFSGTGKVATNILDPQSDDYARGVAIQQQDGKIVAAGLVSDVPSEKIALVRYNPDGSIDEEFGRAGRVVTNFDQGNVAGVVLQPDGKIVVAGDQYSDFALARYNTEGTPDQNFGTDGIVRFDLGAIDWALGVALQPDGKIVVAGQQQPNDLSFASDFAIARFLPTGAPDTSFGEGGKVITDFGGWDIAWAVDIQADGKIVAIGSTWAQGFQLVRGVLARYNPNGTLDSSFGGGPLCWYFQSCGKVKIKLGSGYYDYPISIALRRADGTEDGRIVVAGAFGVARFKADGSLDQDFGNAGIMDKPDNSGNAVAILGDGRIVVAGTNLGVDFSVAMYASTGERCSSLTTDFAGESDMALAMAIQPDGRVVLIGNSHQGTDYDFALARYKVGDCPLKDWWSYYVAFHIFLHPQDPIDGPPPIGQLQIMRSEHFAIPASDGEAFVGPTRPGYHAFRLTTTEGEDRQRGSLVLATNVLGSSMLELLEAQQLLVPTNIAGEQVRGATASGSRSAPLLKCYRVKMHSVDGAPLDRRTFTMTDALGRTQTLQVGEAESFCKPVDRRGRELIGPAISLVSHRIKDIKASGRYARSIRLRTANELGPRMLQVEQAELVYLPSLVE